MLRFDAAEREEIKSDLQKMIQLQQQLLLVFVVLQELFEGHLAKIGVAAPSETPR
mgnify:CR=1 FL=1